MSIEMKSINDLIIKGYNFFIPNYQRGYRWEKIQVEELLYDIHEFAIKDDNNQNEFYCLQPLVLKCKEEKSYEVIDGQQRLTTIYLILKYLENNKLFNLEYDTRKDTKDFFNNIDKIKYEDLSHIDFEYIKKSYETIKTWFDNNDKNELIKNTILNNVKFIWYEPNDNSNPIEIFTRVNIGKIPLTNAELIKALFLQKSNFNENSYLEKEEYEYIQIEISNEWDHIENTLQDNKFWAFINNDLEKEYNRIDYIFELIIFSELNIKNNKNVIKSKIGEDNYREFRFFYEEWKEKNNKNEFIKYYWKKIMECFYTINKWYNDLTLYHYIGYIICISENKKEIFFNLYNLYMEKTKKDFENELIQCIKNNILKNIHYDNNKKRFNLNYDSKHKKEIMKLLLLYNIEYMVLNNNYKFPFDLFKIEKWDIEHIEPRTSNNLNSEDDKKEWLNIIKEDYEEELNKNTSIKIEIEEYLNNDDNIDFEKLYDEIVELLFDKNDDIDIDYLYNLTLLDSSTNRSYGNSFFRSKRKKIIEKDKDGKFIPICTKYIFFKYFNPNAVTMRKWTKEDAKEYEKDIYDKLAKFFE